MNVPVWARRQQTVPAAVRCDTTLPNLSMTSSFSSHSLPLDICWPRERQGYERRFQRLKLAHLTRSSRSSGRRAPQHTKNVCIHRGVAALHICGRYARLQEPKGRAGPYFRV